MATKRYAKVAIPPHWAIAVVPQNGLTTSGNLKRTVVAVGPTLAVQMDQYIILRAASPKRVVIDEELMIVPVERGIATR
jgi:hypothetical protein